MAESEWADIGNLIANLQLRYVGFTVCRNTCVIDRAMNKLPN